jgi:hypothetical protein
MKETTIRLLSYALGVVLPRLLVNVIRRRRKAKAKAEAALPHPQTLEPSSQGDAQGLE